jgi:NAD(P)-dependent dehydrogenase (short-subunit alcohol dehydrogenase family)
MSSKVCLVTGATSGIGRVTARELAQMDATVVAVGRNRQKGEETVAEIKRRSANDKVEFMQADLSSQESIRDLARTFTDKYDQLHVLVNNAGGVFSKRETTVDGLEMTFALDHLAYFLLTALLLPVLERSAPARIINVSSGAQGMGKIDFDDLQGAKRYRGWRAYSQAKLANVLFTYELARRLQGTGVTANCLHPGFVATGFAQNNSGALQALIKAGQVFAISPEKGAETSVFLASSPLVEGVSGKYFANKKEKKSAKQSYDESVTRRLWDVSAQLTGTKDGASS